MAIGLVVTGMKTTVMAKLAAVATETTLIEGAMAPLREPIKFATGDAAAILVYDAAYEVELDQWRVVNARAIGLRLMPPQKSTKAIAPHKVATNDNFKSFRSHS